MQVFRKLCSLNQRLASIATLILNQTRQLTKSIDPHEFLKRPSTKGDVDLKLKMSEMREERIIWLDCEMTGLNVIEDDIMEIACIITEADLEEVARFPSVIINLSDSQLNGMGQWCQKHHGESGLIDACRTSTISHVDADKMLLQFVEKYTPRGVCAMAGNSIYMDRMFIQRQFPTFHAHFHYRNIDVSTIKELSRRWFPATVSNCPKKRFTHRTLEDIEDSIEELKFYRGHVFKSPEVANNCK